MLSKTDLRIEPISFSTIKTYWIEVDHFQDPNKTYVEFPRTLGHLSSNIQSPKSQCYGLYATTQLIGVTQLIEWAPLMVRYRTINIRPEYRGQDLGYFLLETAVTRDWQNFRQLFGWVRRPHYAWSIQHGFKELDGIWTDDHIAMTKPI